jgi:hypothetical protein
MTDTKPCLIACGIMQKEIDTLISQGLIDAEVVFLNKELHVNYRKLERALTQALERNRNRSGAKPVVVYGDVCLGFKNEMQGLLILTFCNGATNVQRSFLVPWITPKASRCPTTRCCSTCI